MRIEVGMEGGEEERMSDINRINGWLLITFREKKAAYLSCLEFFTYLCSNESMGFH